MSNAGRPTLYSEDHPKQAFKLCLLGATDKDLAEFFEVAESTINNWKHEHPEFLESIKRGKTQADAEVGTRLYERALGYSHPEEKIFQYEGQPVRVNTTKHYPPDTTAAIFWLKNRQKEHWRDSTNMHLAGPDGEPITAINVNVIPQPKSDDTT